MVTYRRQFERRGWHRPPLLRFVLVVLGVLLGLVGWVAWALEQEKGGWEGTALEGHFTVEEGIEDVEEGIYRALVRGEEGEVLFEGSSAEEVDEWIESQRNRDFTVPILMLSASAVLLLGGLGPSPRMPDVGADRPTTEVHA